MPIINYTTKVKSENTIAEIQKILVSHGVNKIVTDYENGIPHSVTFTIQFKGQSIFFSLPANFRGVLKAMKNDDRISRKECNEEQAQRVAWRILKDWIEAQMSIVESEQADMAQVFLPYAITKNGVTLYEEMQNSDILMLNK